VPGSLVGGDLSINSRCMYAGAIHFEAAFAGLCSLCAFGIPEIA